MRIDKWLWAARFYKTRGLAAEEIGKGRIDVNGVQAKPAREVKPGDTVAMRRDGLTRTVTVKGLSSLRGPAPVAQQLYEETADSLRERAEAQEQRRFAREPSASIEHGRPTKRGRRELEQAQRGWGDRWSASVDDEPRH
jgi:ribosome-associated heat shock protein Hsp15